MLFRPSVYRSFLGPSIHFHILIFFFRQYYEISVGQDYSFVCFNDSQYAVNFIVFCCYFARNLTAQVFELCDTLCIRMNY
jgi:hypothetical protein